jgi:hypothetical protein
MLFDEYEIYYGPALAGPFYEIGLKILHDLLRSSMGIK